MQIDIRTIPHDEQRYPTVGDWYFDTIHLTDASDAIRILKIRVSDMGNPKFEFLVALHELVEVTLCEAAGITAEEVDKFDIEYEAQRDPEDEDSEPGDSPAAPYRIPHAIATGVERIVAALIGVDWIEYGNAIAKLP